jgi:hypothetical protein
MADETMVEYPRFCTLIVGTSAPEGPCGAQAVGVYQCLAWNSYRFVGSATDVGMEVATNKPVSLCAAHREGHKDWPMIAEFGTFDQLIDAPTPALCGHTALIDDVQHQCDIIGEHVTIELAPSGSDPGMKSPVHSDGDVEWNDDGEQIEMTTQLPTCGDVIVLGDVTRTCTLPAGHVDDVPVPHSDGDVEWPLIAPARGGGKPRR